MPVEGVFCCASCHGLYDDDPAEEKAAEEELARDYPGIDKSECDRLCDDCYNRFNAWRNESELTDLEIGVTLPLPKGLELTESDLAFIESSLAKAIGEALLLPPRHGEQ